MASYSVILSVRDLQALVAGGLLSRTAWTLQVEVMCVFSEEDARKAETCVGRALTWDPPLPPKG